MLTSPYLSVATLAHGVEANLALVSDYEAWVCGLEVLERTMWILERENID